MPVMITPEMVEPVTRALWGAIAVNDGPTDEQVAVLRAVVVHLWQRPDPELAEWQLADVRAHFGVPPADGLG